MPLTSRLAAAFLVVAAAVPAAASPAPRPPVLTSTVVVSGAATAWTRVTLARPTKVDGVPAVTVDRPAHFDGLALVREQRGDDPPALVVQRRGLAAGPAYAYSWVGEAVSGGQQDALLYVHRTLPAGTYRLYLLARGPVRATITFPGVPRGTVRLAPASRTAHVREEQAAAGARGVAVSPAVAFSAVHPVARRGLLLASTWYAGTASAAGQFGGCVSTAADPAPGAPGCPDGLVTVGGVEPELPAGGQSQTAGYGAPGRWMVKGFHVVAGHLTDAGVTLYWLDLGAGFPPAN